MKLSELIFACIMLGVGIATGEYNAATTISKACNDHRVAKLLGNGSITCSKNADTVK